MITSEEFKRKEKLRLISDILSIYFKSTEPDKRDPYWHGSKFDDVWDKDLTELYVTLAVYKRSRDKNHI